MFKKIIRIFTVLLTAALLALSAVSPVSALEPQGNGLKIRNWVVNDTQYTFSEAYKTSVWYENFTSLLLTKNHRNNVLRIAISQLGYHEGDCADDFNGMNRDGTNNYIEYARLIVPNWNDNHYEWCACFVNWCLNQAGIDYAYGEISCIKWVSWLKAKKMFENSAAYKGDYTPQPADMIFFNWDENNREVGHIGYVLYVKDTTVYTVEGNSLNEVGIRSYNLTDPCIVGYGTPPYQEGNEPTLDFSCSDGLPIGIYVTYAEKANLLDADTHKKIVSVPLGATVTVIGTDGRYALVQYGEQSGVMLAKYLCLMTPAYTVTFTADGQKVGEAIFTERTDSLVNPPIPAKEGYNGVWETYSLSNKDITVHAVYTPITYTVTFTADGQTVKTETFTMDFPSVNPPDVPEKEGYVGSWMPYTLSASDITVEAVYDVVPQTDTDTAGTTDPNTDESESHSTQTDTNATDDFGCLSAVPLSLSVLVCIACLCIRKKHDRKTSVCAD